MSGFTNVTLDDADPLLQYLSFQPWKRIQTINPKVRNGTLTEIAAPGIMEFGFTGAFTHSLVQISKDTEHI